MGKNPNKRKKLISRLIILFVLFFVVFASIGLFVYFSFFNTSGQTQPQIENQLTTETENAKNQLKDTNFLKAVLPDSTDDQITYSDYNDFAFNHNFEFDNNAGADTQSRYTGRRINIAVVGLDSRLGTKSNHADANHILSILIDSGKIEIISVPRDTPADAGFDDSTGQNKLTVVRAVKGREFYLKELTKIAHIDKIHYYIEVGFSQVIGILEFLGYKDAKSILQLLRSRKGLGGDDYQRCYNQAQFIRQTILRHYSLINNGISGNLILRAGLALVNTNLNINIVQQIIDKLNLAGFPHSPNDITIKIRPPFPIKYKIYDFTNQDVVNSLIKKIEHFNQIHNEKDTIKINVFAQLESVVSSAERDTLKRPKAVISKLLTYYEQKAWLQIEDENRRELIRRRIENCLVSAYTKLSQPSKASEVKNSMALEREFFKIKKK